MMAHNHFSRRKCTFPLSWTKKTDYENRNIKFIVLYIYLDIYIYIYIYIFFFLGGGGERVRYEEYGNSSPVPNLYLRSIVMNSPLNF